MDITFEIRTPHEVAFPRRVETRDPAPRESVRSSIPVEEMTKEKIRPKLPGEPLDMDPVRGPPHSRVIVEVSGLEQLPRKMIHDFDPAFSSGNGKSALVRCPVEGGEIGAVGMPDARPQLEPAFPVETPQDFVLEFRDGVGAMPGSRRCADGTLEEQSRPRRGGQAGDIRVAGFDEVSPLGVVGRPRQEFLEADERFSAGRRERSKWMGLRHAVVTFAQGDADDTFPSSISPHPNSAPISCAR